MSLFSAEAVTRTRTMGLQNRFLPHNVATVEPVRTPRSALDTALGPRKIEGKKTMICMDGLVGDPSTTSGNFASMVSIAKSIYTTTSILPAYCSCATTNNNQM